MEKPNRKKKGCSPCITDEEPSNRPKFTWSNVTSLPPPFSLSRLSVQSARSLSGIMHCLKYLLKQNSSLQSSVDLT